MSIVNIFHTKRGAQQATDGNGYIYYFNRKTDTVSYWLCKQRSCNIRMTTLNTTSELVGNAWPVHGHGINLLKRQAKKEQDAAIKKYSTLPGTSTKAMLGEISKNLLASSTPNAIYGMDSGSALKMALWRNKQKENPIPQLPKSHDDVMKTDIPQKFSKTADNREFLILKAWTNATEMESALVFMSDSAADIMRRAPTWLMDGTFKTRPAPYYQVNKVQYPNCTRPPWTICP
jgi:hypothetical protein